MRDGKWKAEKLEYCLSDAGIGTLDMEHGADGGRNVYDMSGARRGTLRDVPSEEHEGDV